MNKYLGKDLIKVLGSKVIKGLDSKAEDGTFEEGIDINEIWKKVNNPISDIKTDEWDAILDKDNKTITLLHYIGNNADVIVKDRYTINGINYKTKLCNTQHDDSSTQTISLFNQCRNIVSIEFKEGIDYSELTDMSSMFGGCNNLKSIIFPEDFDTSRVTNMNFVFQTCNILISLDLTMFDTSNVETMYYMFDGTKNLEEILVSRAKWNTSKANKAYMFANSKCRDVTYIEDL